MTSLTALHLHNNNLTGALPSKLDASMGLRLYGNRFSGIVPEDVCGILWCNCSQNGTPPVSTCSDLKEAPTYWPGRFPTIPGAVMLNIYTDDFPQGISWIWQNETDVTGIWDTLKPGGPLAAPRYLHSSLFLVNTDTAYRFIVSDWFGDGMSSSVWITLTRSNETLLFSFVGGEAFSEIIVGIMVGADGSSFDITNSTA